MRVLSHYSWNIVREINHEMCPNKLKNKSLFVLNTLNSWLDQRTPKERTTLYTNLTNFPAAFTLSSASVLKKVHQVHLVLHVPPRMWRYKYSTFQILIGSLEFLEEEKCSLLYYNNRLSHVNILGTCSSSFTVCTLWDHSGPASVLYVINHGAA